MRQLPITLLHIVAPCGCRLAGGPAGYANMTEWQRTNAQQVIEQARGALTSSWVVKPPQVHTEVGLFQCCADAYRCIPTGLI